MARIRAPQTKKPNYLQSVPNNHAKIMHKLLSVVFAYVFILLPNINNESVNISDTVHGTRNTEHRNTEIRLTPRIPAFVKQAIPFPP
jgi:hypothetical protein